MKKITEIKKKTIIQYICLLFVVLTVLYVIKGKFIGEVQDNYFELSVEHQEISIAGNKIEQNLTIQGQIKSMKFYMKNRGKGTETIHMELWNSERTQKYLQEEVVVPTSGDREFIFEWTPKQVDLQGTAEVILTISGQESADSVSVYVQNSSAGQAYRYNGSEQIGHVKMAVIYGYVQYWAFLLVFGVVLFSVGVACIYAWNKKLGIEKLFALIALATGIGIALINPFGQEPDGWTHFRRAMDVSYGNILAPFENIAHEDGYNIQPENMSDIHYEIIDTGAGEGYEYLRNLMDTKFSKETMLQEGENGYTSLYYFPQALGTLIGRTLNLSIYGCMVLGRTLNLLCYVALAYWALKLMPIYKNLLIVIALLPMTIYQAASYSPDALLNGLCFLFTALCFYYAFGEKEKLNWKNMIMLGIMLVVLFMCKYVYVCLGILVFLIPMRKFGSKKEYWKAFGIAVLPLVIVMLFYGWMFVINHTTVENESIAGEVIAETVGTVAKTQFDYVKQNPVVLIKVLLRTVWTYSNTYVQWLNTLGSLNYSMDKLEIIIPWFMIVVACLDTEGIQQKVKIKHRILFFFTGIVIIVLGMVGLYLMDTVANPVGVNLINGYQTRYAIPCMVLLLSVFGSGKVTNKINNFSVKVLGCMGVFLIGTIFMLVHICY